MVEDLNFAKEILKNIIKSIRFIFKYKNTDRENVSNKILVAGGYGYGNTGDEAQCSATLTLLSELYKDYEIINLTPNIEYSKSQHPQFRHELASRVLFFNQMRNNNCFDFDNSNLKKMIFLLKSALIYFNTILIRANLPTIFINVEISKFLYELKTAKLFYFCGGGYLTGSTLSRLWDGIILCRCCHLLGVPVVMSGQTIGVWGNKFNEWYAKWGFKHVKLITFRDNKLSLKDLEKIGLSGDNYFPTHDDALFCAKAENSQINIQNYLTINFHYWGMCEKDKTSTIEKIHNIVDYILKNSNYTLVFAPMHWTDKFSFDDYITKYPSNRFLCFEYDYDFRKIRRLIADSQMCITMKHHPIIFAVGEDIPVMSLAFSRYYIHKNIGALNQYGIDKYCVNLEKEDFFENFVKLYSDINENYSDIINIIKGHKNILQANKNLFMKKVSCLIK